MLAGYSKIAHFEFVGEGICRMGDVAYINTGLCFGFTDGRPALRRSSDVTRAPAIRSQSKSSRADISSKTFKFPRLIQSYYNY